MCSERILPGECFRLRLKPAERGTVSESNIYRHIPPDSSYLYSIVHICAVIENEVSDILICSY